MITVRKKIKPNISFAKLSLIFLALFILVSPFLVKAADFAGKECHTLERPIGSFGANTPICGPVAYLEQVYDLSLGLGVFLAAAMITYGGFLYATSRGNSGQQTEGKKYILNALFGLALLFGTVLILKTINPDLANPEKFTESILGVIPEAKVDENPSKDCSTWRSAYEKCWLTSQRELKKKLTAADAGVLAAQNCSTLYNDWIACVSAP